MIRKTSSAGLPLWLFTMSVFALSNVSAAAAQTSPDAATPAAVPVPVAVDEVAAATAYCRTQAVVKGTNAPLIFYNSFLDELGRIANPEALKIRVDDCDPYFFYLNAEDVQKVGVFSPHYHHTRVAVKREDVVIASLSSLMTPAPVSKPKTGTKKSAVKK